MGHNALVSYAPILEHHHPIMSTLVKPGVQLKRERERDSSICNYHNPFSIALPLDDGSKWTILAPLILSYITDTQIIF